MVPVSLWEVQGCDQGRGGGGGVFGKSPVSPLLALCRSFTRKAQSIFFFAYNLIITIIW